MHLMNKIGVAPPKIKLRAVFAMVAFALAVLTVAGCLYNEQEGGNRFLPQECEFYITVSCLDHLVEEDQITLSVLNYADRDVIVRNIVATSDAFEETFPGSGEHHNCSLGNAGMDKNLKDGEKYIFILNRSTGGGECAYNDVGRSRNRYDLELVYSWADNDEELKINHTIKGTLLSFPPE